jgi:hypothetical protein
VFFAVGGTAVSLIQKAWWDSEDVPALQEAIANQQGFEGTDEYDLAGDDHTNLPQKAARVQILPLEEPEMAAPRAGKDALRNSGQAGATQVLPGEGAGPSGPKAEIQIGRWTAEEREISVTSSKPVRLAVRLLSYPAWSVEVNGKAVKPELAGTTAQIILQANAGTQRIRIKFVRTPDRTLGGAISAGAGIVLLGLFFLGRARQQSRNA